MSSAEVADDLPDAVLGPLKPQSVIKPEDQKKLSSRRSAVDISFAEEFVLYHDIFEHLPIAIWEEDYSGPKTLIDQWRNEGVDDFQSFFQEHPDKLRLAIGSIKTVRANKHALKQYGFSNRAELFEAETRGLWLEEMDYYGEEFSRLANGEFWFEIEAPIQWPDGSERIIRDVVFLPEQYREDWSSIISTEEDITALKKAEKDLRKINLDLEDRGKEQTSTLRKLSHAIGQSPTAVFITDIDGTIEYINPKFTELTGYTADEAIGQNPRILKSDETAQETYADLWQTIQSGKVWVGEIKDRRKNGDHFWAMETISPLTNESGEITHYVATHEDISQRKDAEFAIQTALEHADVANRAKSELLANMSHELRTPLNAIIGFAGAIKEEIFGPIGNEKYREYNDDIANSGQHLLELINDILDVSAIEAGMMELNEGDLEIGNVVESCIRLIRQRAEQGNINLTTNIDDRVPMLYADERRIKQILLNLLSNAIKFTRPDGSVSLSVALDEEDRHVFTVADTGIGMNKIELAKAMQKFGQVGRGKEAKHEGTGLGLPLTKGLIKLHGGTMTIDSERGVGTTVTMKFPNERVVTDA